MQLASPASWWKIISFTGRHVPSSNRNAVHLSAQHRPSTMATQKHVAVPRVCIEGNVKVIYSRILEIQETWKKCKPVKMTLLVRKEPST